MILYRPVGIEELALIFESGMREFPPRLPEQPIFYPVTNFGYARQIAEGWNTKSGSNAGYVTTFTVDDEYASRFERQIVGGREHEELWVPAEQLHEFNQHIQGFIEVDSSYFGNGFKGLISNDPSVSWNDADDQFISINLLSDLSRFFQTPGLRTSIYCHYPYWRNREYSDVGLSPSDHADRLEAVQSHWNMTNPTFPLPRLARQLE
ncbi:hypothetical protein JIN85_04145 [Luteolibacter pohnpeiensis]|uniref:Uncharacterized protein n=1 Tax=Luteolibacter pohnpeiensis TaxID=454153 RepID=A0A934S354_9BACT|nr:hypothetical protein [Luteolibacter pohnpeiensis]MBK1881591.1 hypothetical protein [Luteolibacter pohnpeiensis]